MRGVDPEALVARLWSRGLGREALVVRPLVVRCGYEALVTKVVSWLGPSVAIWCSTCSEAPNSQTLRQHSIDTKMFFPELTRSESVKKSPKSHIQATTDTSLLPVGRWSIPHETPDTLGSRKCCPLRQWEARARDKVHIRNAFGSTMSRTSLR